MKLKKEKNLKEAEVKKNKIKSLKKNKRLIMLVICLIIILVLVIIFINFALPNIYITSINNNYNSNNYNKVARYNAKLNFIQNYLRNDNEEYKNIQYKVKYSLALTLFDNEQFERALNELSTIELLDEKVKNKINDCKYELGKKYLEDKEYDKAVEYLQEVTDKEDFNDLLNEAHYNLAIKYLENSEYIKAIKEIEKVNDKKYKDLEKTKKQIHYKYGIYSFNRGDYSEAVSQFKLAGNYEDAKTYINNAKILQAEELIDINEFSKAKDIYKGIPTDTEYKGIKASVRKKQLNTIEGILDDIGKKYATKTYCETRNVWKYDGRWESWYIDTPSSAEYINTSIELNDNGTFTLSGTAYFYAYNDFSSLAEYCVPELMSRTFEIENINKIPSKYSIDKNTDLLYSKGKFSIEYSKEDNYSINFYNVYSTTITY